jgi:hypothetical protein
MNRAAKDGRGRDKDEIELAKDFGRALFSAG